MTKEEAKKFGLQLLHGVMERNESYPVYANNVKQAIDALSESSSSETPNDLEEAAEKFARFYDQGTCDGIAQDCFIAGAKWDRSQMMREAVEGEVFMSFAPGHNQMVMADVDLPTNTKVRIIIIKDDGKSD